MSATTTATRLPANRLELQFREFPGAKQPLSQPEAVAEANRCINCFAAPCVRACPTSIDIPKFIRRIAADQVKGAARAILDSNILGLSCAQACPTEVLCEGACVYNDLDGKPISIGKLQRYAVEQAYDHGWEFYAPGAATGKKVALVGGGAASLACAHELRRLGHEAVVFEKSQVLGGLNTTGIAPYKLQAEVSLREIERILKMGVKVELGRELGPQAGGLQLGQLLKDYDAVFLGIGLGPDSRLPIEGAQGAGVTVTGAVALIAKLKTLPRTDVSELQGVHTALVVGGGNTALDACRELKGLGLERVVTSYRRPESEMSGYAHELKAARQEGVEFWFSTVPAAVERSATGPEVILKRTTIDAHGRVQTTGESLRLPFGAQSGLIVLATGQAKLESLLKGGPGHPGFGLEFEEGRLVADPETGRTGHKQIYAGGDLVNGGKEVVNAVAEGKRAATAMHREILSRG